MSRVLPPPDVPDLEPENYIDLDRLGSADLATWVNYPGIDNGDTFWPNWRGCGAAGQVVDFFDSLIEVVDKQPEGMLVMIANRLVKELEQGWVFYSYQMEDVSAPDGRGEESPRRFFYIGKPATAVAALAVPQCKESHELYIDPAPLHDIDSVTIVTLPYRAMLVGDKVTLQLDRFFGEGDPWEPLKLTKTLKADQLGQPLVWDIEPTDFLIIEDGFVEMRYSVEYAEPTTITVSATQTLHIVAPPTSTPMLPAPQIKDLNGGSLDPAAFPDGIILQIDLYAGIQSGDDVVLYATSRSKRVQTLRVDPSTLASGVLQFKVEHAWLSENNGEDAQFVYQYAREGIASSSLPRLVLLRQPLNLPPPLVEEATAEDDGSGEAKGYLFAIDVVEGVRIRLPEGANPGAGDTVQMHWDGYGSSGSVIADPSATDPELFLIPASAVPANMGKRLDVYYKVSPIGEPSGTSKVFDLEVRRLDSGWPTIQLKRPPVNDGRISLADVPAEGAGLDLGSWTYMAERQRVRIKAKGLLQTGNEETFDMRTGAAEAVTEVELQNKTLSVLLSRDFLQRLQLNQQFSVTVEISFDEGASYLQLPSIHVQLVQ